MADGASEAGPGSIRLATQADAEFLASSNLDHALEIEDLRLDPETVRSGVDAVLVDSSKGQYYVVEMEGSPAAELLVTFEWSDWRNAQYWWIQSLYVVPEHRRKGIFRQLYAHVKQRAREEGAAGVRLYVDTDNATAQATYTSLGMTSHYKVMEELFDH